MQLVVVGAARAAARAGPRAGPARGPRRRSPAPRACRRARSRPRPSAPGGWGRRARRCGRSSPLRRWGRVAVAACSAACIARLRDARSSAARAWLSTRPRAIAAIPMPSPTPRARFHGELCTGYRRLCRLLPRRVVPAARARDDGPMSATTFTSYEQAREQHRWGVPERYNIAVDVCDRHPRDKLAMIHEDFPGRIREVSWGELQDDSNRFANVLARTASSRAIAWRCCCRRRPRPRRRSSASWKAGAILLSMSVLYGDEGIRHRVTDSQAKVLVTNAGQRRADRARPGRAPPDPRRRAARARLDRFHAGRHRGR